MKCIYKEFLLISLNLFINKSLNLKKVFKEINK